MQKLINLLDGVDKHGIIYILTYFPIRLYFTQYGKIVDKRTYQKVSIKPTKGFYYYGVAKNNPNF